MSAQEAQRLPDVVLKALRERALSFNEICALAGIHGTALMVTLRQAEAQRLIRYARGRYELAAPPVIGLTAADQPEPEPPAPDPFAAEAAASVAAPPAPPRETKPPAAATKPPGRETKPPVPATKPAAPKTKAAKRGTKAHARETPMPPAPSTRICKACGEKKPLETKYFQRHPQCPGGWENRCKDCKRAGIKIKRGTLSPPTPKVQTPAPKRGDNLRLHIPARTELRAQRTPEGGCALSSGSRQIEIPREQMAALVEWWHAIGAPAA